jgi:hypothetical protein
MKIAILEIVPDGHFTYVESIAAIYSAVADNEVTIYTTPKGKSALQHLENQQISIKIIENTEGGILSKKLQAVADKNYDKLFVVTLEAYTKSAFQIAQVFEKINFNCPIYYVIHNTDFWFERSIVNKLKSVFSFKHKNFNSFIYQAKIHFYYLNVHKKIIKKIINTNGRFVCLSETVGKELSKFVGIDKVAVIPFSVFDNKIIDQSDDNQRIRVCLPGYVSAIRRDYDSILEVLAHNTEGGKNWLTIEFLGGIAQSDGGEIIKNKALTLKEKGVDLIIYDKPFVSLQEFDANLAKADIVLGNLHLKQGVKGSYGKTKESGLLFTMIKAAKAGLVPNDYPIETALSTSILTFNSYKEAFDILIDLAKNKAKLNLLKQKARENSEIYRPLNIYNRLENHNAK